MATIELNKAAKQPGADHPHIFIGTKFKSHHKYGKGAILVLTSLPQCYTKTGVLSKTAALVLVDSGKVWGDSVYPREGTWDIPIHVKWTDIAMDIKKYELEQLPLDTKIGVIV